jgi:hypothetical protein
MISWIVRGLLAERWTATLNRLQESRWQLPGALKVLLKMLLCSQQDQTGAPTPIT